MKDIFQKCREFAQFEDKIILQKTGRYPYFRPVSSAEEAEIIFEGRKLVMLGSNNYLGLTTHPKVIEAAVEATKKYGTGSCGSRFLNGTLEIHLRLEHKLAEFVGKEAALVFSTGYQTNIGILTALIGRGDFAVLDKWDHASIIDGARMSYGEIKRFKHNDLEDLEKVLASIPDDKAALIVVDGVFSMEGDIADLPGILKVAKKYGARVMTDDAHAMGVLGKNGSGTASHFGVTDETDIIMSTFSKSFASIGGFVAGDADVVDYIKHFGRSMIFSAALPPAAVAAAEAALDIMINEPERREQLWKNTHRWQEGLKSMGYDIGETQTPIVPVIIGDDKLTFEMWYQLQQNGVFVNPVITPAVPPGRQLLRTSIMATHTDEMIDRALEAFEKVGKKLGVIS